MSDLRAEYDFFVKNRQDLVEQHRGKFAVIKGLAVIGVYSDELEALTETSKSHRPGTFIIEKCEPDVEGSIQMFHSRVAFA